MSKMGTGHNFQAGWVVGGYKNDNRDAIKEMNLKEKSKNVDNDDGNINNEVIKFKAPKRRWLREAPGAFSYSCAYMPYQQYPPPPAYPVSYGYHPHMGGGGGGYYGGGYHGQPGGYPSSFGPQHQGYYGFGHGYGGSHMNKEFRGGGGAANYNAQHEMVKHAHDDSYGGTHANTAGFTSAGGGYHGGYAHEHDYNSGGHMNGEMCYGGATNKGSAHVHGHGQQDMAKQHAHDNSYGGTHANTAGFTSAGGGYHGGYAHGHEFYSGGQMNGEMRYGGATNKGSAPVHGHGQQDMAKHAHGQNYGGTHVNTTGFTTAGGATAGASANCHGGQHYAVAQNTGVSAGGGASAAVAVSSSGQQQAQHDMSKYAHHEHAIPAGTGCAAASASASAAATSGVV